jgi:hypothetical protein
MVTDDGTTGYGKPITDRMSAPTGACRRMISSSEGVRRPGLFRNVFGTLILPTSWSSDAAFNAWYVSFVGDSERRGKTHRVVLDTPDVIVSDLIFGVDRLSQRLDRGDIDAIHPAEMFDLILRPADGVAEGDIENHRQRHDQQQTSIGWSG